ncbi:MAG: hypothetical protein WKF87_15105 [Chryseolinea sp.]
MKAPILITIVAMLTLVNYSPCYSQKSAIHSRDLSWQSSELTDKSNSKKLNQPHRLDTHNKNYIELHRGSEQTLRFNINAVKGEWMDEGSDGTLVYDVTSENGVPGVITMSRSSGITRAHIDFTQTNKNALHIELIVSGVH